MMAAMSEEQHLLWSVLERPDDDGLRLVYADWLEDRGDARAELVRLRCRLRELGPHDRPRRELETRERQLVSENRGRWVDQCGLPLTWELLVALLRVRIGEAAAWCKTIRGLQLRSPELRPARLLSEFEVVEGRPVWRHADSAAKQAVVNDLARQRADLLRLQGRLPTEPASGLHRGRLLLFDTEATPTLIGGPSLETDGYFDRDNVPGWDTWLAYVDDQAAWTADWGVRRPWLVCWVPSYLLGAAAAGVRLNPVKSLIWADEARTVLGLRLRAAGLASNDSGP
jgi:uncharacterized protein (TIGR02996 family)